VEGGIRKRRRRSLAIAICGAVALLGLIWAVGAGAELTQKGNLFVRFDGGLQPPALPRDRPAPIAVRIEGTIRVPSGQEPPALRRIRVALNKAGRMDTRGLPSCRKSELDSVDSAKALARCGSALVGSGGITAITSFEDQPNYLMRGEVLLFNASVHGKEAILAHVFQNKPVPIIRVITFHITHPGGRFGTVLDATIPKSMNRNGYLKSIYLQLQRKFVYRGQRRSYLSANCGAPSGFGSASFPFAHASMSFDDGRTLASTLIRTCRVS